MHNLSELQQDALLEIFNVSIGRAAAAMSDMVNETIDMSVPAMQFITRKQAGDILDLKGKRRVCSVTQGFAGTFSGEAVLMFPEENSLEIVRMMLGSTIPLAHLTELEQDALNEVGNIILNSCISAFADIFQEQFDTTLPEVRVGSGMEAVGVSVERQQDGVLFLHIQFAFQRRKIEGYVVFLMDLPSFANLRAGIDRFLGLIPQTGGNR